MEENIKVVVRIRPLQLNEKKKGDYSCVKPLNSGKEVQIKVGPLDAQTYKCHKCFPIETTQEDFFAESGIVDLLDSSIAGYHSCAFAFGQTGAGKTYTMIGPAITTTNNSNSVGASTGGTAAQKNNSYSFNSVNFVGKQSGMIIKSLNYLYQKLAEMNVKYKVSLSCIEIYQENVFDLLSEEKERSSLAVREHATKGFFLEGCKLVECVSYDIACAALEVAMKNRSIGSHELNNKSSRSHCLTEIHIELPVSEEMRNDLKLPDTDDGEQDKRDYVLKGRMYLVDLAGSERLKGTNSSGKILQEAGFINKSLYVLGKVIAGLVRTNGDLNHKDVPFRDSKLTKLLISSLGGKSRTLLISCVTEAKGSQAETLRTLKFSMSCARIRNKPVKFLDPQEKLILDLREEIKRLKVENTKLRSTIVTAPVFGGKGQVGQRLDIDADILVVPRSISAQDKVLYHSSTVHGAMRGGGKNKKAIKKGIKQKSVVGVNRRLPFVLPRNDKGDDDSLDSEDASSSYSHGSRIRNAHLQVEDVIRRHVTGPMVLKGKDVAPMFRIQTDENDLYGGGYGQYRSPKSHTSEEARIRMLEDKIARIEQLTVGAAAANNNIDKDIASDQSLGIVGGGDYPFFGAPDKTEQPAEDIISVGIKKKKKKKKIVEEPGWKKSKQVSPYIAHLIKDSPKSKGPPKIVDQEVTTRGIAASNTKKVPQPAKIACKLDSKATKSAVPSEKVDPLDAYLNDMDDDEIPKKKKKSLPSKGARVDSIATSLPEIPAARVKNSGTEASKSKTNHNDENITKFPEVEMNLQNKYTGKNMEKDRAIKIVAPCSREKPSPYLANPKKNEKSSRKANNSKSYEAVIQSPTLLNVQHKLQALEKALAEQREEMEDNPGEVTSESEERIAELETEVQIMREEFEREKRMYSYEDHNERGPASYDKSADQLEDSGNGFPVPNAVHSIAMSLGIDVETSAPTETSSYLPSIKSAKQKEVSVDQPTEVQVRSVVSARIGEIARDDEGDYDHDDYYEDFEDGHTADNQQPTCGGDDKEEKYSSSSSSKISASNTIDYNAAPPIPDVDLIWEESVLIAGRSQYVDQGKDAKDLVQQAKEMDDEDEYDNDFHEDTEHQIAADKDSESNIGATGEGIGQIDSTNSYHVSPNSVTNSSTVQKNSNQEEEEHYDTSHRKTGLTGSKNNHPRVSTAQSESDAYGDDFDDYDQDDDFKD